MKKKELLFCNKLSAKVLFFICISVISLAGLSQDVTLKEPVFPVPENAFKVDPQVSRLGLKLFEERRLSKNGTISCATCHSLSRGGVDGLVHSVGINGMKGGINAPTVFNSAFNFKQFWNGRAKTLEDQIDGPVQNPKEMDADWEEVVRKLKNDESYVLAFRKIYADGITKQNIKNAIADFERSLVTPNCKFDQYLNGNQAALSELEKSGYHRFKSFGCIACHQGLNVGGNMFQTMGVMGNYFKDRGTPITEADLGRYTVTKEEADRFVFRVPSLRNVELTAPYFHDGSAQTLDHAVRVMAKYQLGRRLSTEETNSIVAFLKTLTGELPKSIKDAQK